MNKKRINQIALILPLVFTHFINLCAQDITLQEVTFYPPVNPTGWVTILADNVNMLVPQHATTLVHAWNSTNPAASQPVAYVSGYKARVSAKFIDQSVACPISSMYVKAEVTIAGEKYKLPSKKLSTGFEYPVSDMDKVFKKYLVQFIPAFKLDWYYTTTPNLETSWKPAGSSTNLLMVTHKEPVYGAANNNDDEGTTFFNSCIYLACQFANGTGLNGTSADPDAVMEAIFLPFRSRCIFKPGGTHCMTYWGNQISPTCRNIQGLLSFQDANCGEWSSFFQDMLKIQGIGAGKRVLVTYQQLEGNIGVLAPSTEFKLYEETNSFFGSADQVNIQYIKYNGKTEAFFCVKNYDFEFNSATQNFYLDAHKPDPPAPNPQILTTNTNKVLKASNRTGAAAQGNPDPRSIFENHSMMSFTRKNGSKIYLDPSYGTPLSGFYANSNDYETDSFTAFGAAGYYSHSTGLQIIIWINELNTSTQQLNFN